VISRGDGWMIVSGRMRLDSIPEAAHLAEGGDIDSSSLGGLLMEKLGRPAVVGDTVEIDGLKVTALKVLRNRIKLVRVDYTPQPEPQEAPL
jgi:putative hemolysin